VTYSSATADVNSQRRAGLWRWDRFTAYLPCICSRPLLSSTSPLLTRHVAVFWRPHRLALLALPL